MVPPTPPPHFSSTFRKIRNSLKYFKIVVLQNVKSFSAPPQQKVYLKRFKKWIF